MNPAGRAIFHPPDLALIDDYMPGLDWAYLFESAAMTSDYLQGQMSKQNYPYLLVADEVEHTVIGLVSRPVIKDIKTKVQYNRYLQRCVVYAAKTIIELPQPGKKARLLKDRMEGLEVGQDKVDRLVEDMLHRMTNLDFR